MVEVGIGLVEGEVPSLSGFLRGKHPMCHCPQGKSAGGSWKISSVSALNVSTAKISF